MEKSLIHSNEYHLIDADKIYSAVKGMTEKLGLAAGSTDGFDLYAVVGAYFTDIEAREDINRLLCIDNKDEEMEEEGLKASCL